MILDATILLRDLRRMRIDGEIVDRAHSDYDGRRRVWNAMANRLPTAIVRARSVLDVEKVVTIAAQHGSLLAVRGGGHSIPGLSTCDDGIVLDLSLMNSVNVDSAAGQAEVLGGALLGDLDRAGAQAELVVPAGVVSHTGVAGLTLGGGMGWLSRRFGLTIDSLLAADVVTADGRSRHVSVDADPDLFWAIRGGGGNFGVVTKFTFKMHPLAQVLIGDWAYSVADAGAVLELYSDLVANSPRELTAGFVLTSAGLRIIALWSGTPHRAESALAPFGSLGKPKSASIGDLTFMELQTMSDEDLAWNRRYYTKGGFFLEIDDHAIERMVDCIASAPTAGAEIFVQHLGGAVADIDEDATAYSGRAAGFYWIVQSGWDREADDERIVAWNRMSAANLGEVSMRENYVNEQAEFGKDVALAAYGEGKYSRLAELKARYDPDNLFRLNQNIEPKQ